MQKRLCCVHYGTVIYYPNVILPNAMLALVYNVIEKMTEGVREDGLTNVEVYNTDGKRPYVHVNFSLPKVTLKGREM